MRIHVEDGLLRRHIEEAIKIELKGLKSKRKIVDAQIIVTSPGVFVLALSGLELIPPCKERRGEDAVSGSELNTILLEGGRSIRFRTNIFY